MAGKAPKPLRKPIKDSVFQKKWLKFIEHSDDRLFFTEAFLLHDAQYHVRDDLSKKDLKRLSALVKSIKKNRGSLKIVPLSVLVLLIASVSLFFLFFFNPLVKNVARNGLESVFEAKVELGELNVDILHLSVSLSSLSIADRDNPMTNLVESGPMVVRFNLGALLQAKIYIEEVRAEALAFGSPRSSSGALEQFPAVKKPEAEKKPESPPLVDLENFDAEALLEREKDKLKSLALYEQTEEVYTQSLERWSGQRESSESRINDLRESAASVLAIKPENIDSIETIRSTISDINSLYQSLQSLASEFENIRSSMASDIDRARLLEQQLRGSLQDDIEHLKSYVQPSSGAALDALEPSIKAVLSDSVERYLDLGKRGLEIARKIKQYVPDNDEEAIVTEVPKGRDVLYPSIQYPAFRLGLLHSDFTADGKQWLIELKELSSNPDLTGTPSSLIVSIVGEENELHFNGQADLSSTTASLFQAQVKAAGLPVNIGSLLEDAGIQSFTGNAAVILEAKGEKDDSLSMQADLVIQDSRLGAGSGTLVRALAEAVETVDTVEFDIGYEKSPVSGEDFSLDTNLDELVSQALRATAKAYAAEAEAAIEEAVRDWAAKELQGDFASREELDTLFAAVKGDVDAVDSIQNRLDAKKTELENRVKEKTEAAVRETTDKAREEVEKKASELLEDSGLSDLDTSRFF